MRQIGLMLQMYSGDNEVYPKTEKAPGGSCGLPGDNEQRWYKQLARAKYVEDEDNLAYKLPPGKLYCPTNKGSFTYAYPLTDNSPMGIGGDRFCNRYVRPEEVRNASRCVVLIEMRAGWQRMSGSSATYTSGWNFALHSGGANFLFADNHIERKPDGFMVATNFTSLVDIAQ
jgi:prepilin-type processing-associated H-X9-DG protein